MTVQKLLLRPGINSQYTPTLNEGGWSQSQLIRFKDGVPQKIGGWMHINPAPLVDIARGMAAWTDLSQINYLVVGSAQRLQILSSNVITDITPIRSTSNAAPTFSTTINTTGVNINIASHGASVGDWVNLTVPVSVGGLVLIGYYQVTAVTDANNFSITSPVVATSTTTGGAVPSFTTINTSQVVTVTLANHGYVVGNLFNVAVSTAVGGITLLGQFIVNSIVSSTQFTIQSLTAATSGTTGSENGGNAQVVFLLQSGLTSAVYATGYGTGYYGLGTWGTSSGGQAFTPLRAWALSNFGQNLIASFTNGGMYQWVPPTSSGLPAQTLANAPLYQTWSLVASAQQQIISLGAEAAGTQDPMLVRYCDVANQTSWTATATNQAGSFRLSRGSKIVGALQAGTQILIWTDVGVWSMTYIQPPFVYSFNELGQGCGLLAARAACSINQSVLWMSRGRFMQYDNQGLREVPCTVYDYIFRNLNTMQAEKITCCANSMFNEVTWFFPSASGNGEVDSYVKIHLTDGTWDYGSLARTSWIDQSVLGPPIGVDLNGNVQMHETTNDADGAVLNYSYQSSFVDIGCDEYMFVDKVIPDFAMAAGSVALVTVITKDYSQGVSRYYGPFAVSSTSRYFNPKARGRYMSIKVEGKDLGSFTRLGAVQYRLARQGRNS